MVYRHILPHISVLSYLATVNLFVYLGLLAIYVSQAYLSLPEGAASVAGLIAMMTDHYNLLVLLLLFLLLISIL